MIAALPFQNMSGDPEQEYFADGTTGLTSSGDVQTCSSGYDPAHTDCEEPPYDWLQHGIGKSAD